MEEVLLVDRASGLAGVDFVAGAPGILTVLTAEGVAYYYRTGIRGSGRRMTYQFVAARKGAQ
jgi:hypothetical protein